MTTTTHTHRYDVAVIGGGAAGLAAALQLGRSRRSVVVIDAGEPRNAPAAHMHGYLGHDGLSPAEFLAIGRREARAYGVDIWESCTADVSRLGSGAFLVECSNGAGVEARRIVLATGLVDILPDIPGVRDQWGRGVIHCPYCHGWEVRDQQIVVVATGPGGWNQAGLFRQLSDDVTVIVHDGGRPEGDVVDRLLSRHLRIVDERVAEVVSGPDGSLLGARLETGELIPADAVVVGPTVVPRIDSVASLGISAVPDPMGMGDIVATDEFGRTEIDGLYAAGNVADLRAQVLQAAAAGAQVGAMVNMDLVADDTDSAVTRAETAAEFEGHYREQEHRWSGRPNEALLAEMTGVEPGRALDVGCGEGADVIWLAEHGWKTTGLDVAETAIGRGRTAAEDAGVSADWIVGDIADAPLAEDGYDLVATHFPALRQTGDNAAVRALLGAVAPGGTLLVVGHAPMNPEFAREHGFELSDFVQVSDIVDHLDETWEIETHETRLRQVPLEHGPFTHDEILRARRTD